MRARSCRSSGAEDLHHTRRARPLGLPGSRATVAGVGTSGGAGSGTGSGSAGAAGSDNGAGIWTDVVDISGIATAASLALLCAASSNNAMHSREPLSCASVRADDPLKSASGLARAASKALTHRAWPPWQARISGEAPSASMR